MTPVIERSPKVRPPWAPLASVALLIAVCYAPIIRSLVRQWIDDPDMGHGFFVPAVSAYIVWQRREEILAITPRPNWWGLLVVLFGSLQAMVGTLGVELFTSRSAMVVTLIGAVWLLGGTEIVKKLAFPLFLLFFMVPIPTVVYNQLTFSLQILASRLATDALMLIQIPVLREGNVLELPTQKLSVVEACSGIRSLLSLTFLSLVYGYFFERKRWIRVTLFLTTIPIAIIANGSRVTFTGILSQIRPDLAEGFFHESTGMVIFLVAAVILFVVHQALIRGAGIFARVR
jgi:exosortase